MCEVSIYDVSVLDEMGEICQHQAVQISSGRFTSIRPFTATDKRIRAEQKIDGSGKLLKPPLADCHMHTG